MPDARARHEGIREELAAAVKKSPGKSGAFFVSLCIGGHRTGGKPLR